MSVHINTTSAMLRDELKIDQPVIAAAYLKFDPTPERWMHLLEQDAQNDIAGYATAVENAPELDILKRYAEVTATIASVGGGDVRSQLVVKEGCLEIFIFLAGYLSDMFKPEIKKLLVDLYNNKKATPEEVRVFTKKMILRMEQANGTLKNVARGLYGAAIEVLGDDNLKPRTPEARLGIPSNLVRFHGSLTAAKHSPLPMAERVQHIEQALRQLQCLERNVLEAEDKKFVYMYLDLRTRGKKLFAENAKYDAAMRQILEIRDKFGECMEDDY